MMAKKFTKAEEKMLELLENNGFCIETAQKPMLIFYSHEQNEIIIIRIPRVDLKNITVVIDAIVDGSYAAGIMEGEHEFKKRFRKMMA